MPAIFLLLGLLLVPFHLNGLGVSASFRPVEVPVLEEETVAYRHQAEGIITTNWYNAVAEISGFQGLETVPLASLDARLTPQDPRWDPWLRAQKGVFQPRPGFSRIWVDAAHFDEAVKLLGSAVSAPAGSHSEARRVTGWMLVFFSVLYLVFRLPGGWVGRLWRSGGIALLILAAGTELLITDPLPQPLSVVESESWAHHRWYQESLPFGATWDDWRPPQAWGYLTYERRDGKVMEVHKDLQPADAAWASREYATLEPTHSARLFGLQNP